MNDNMRIVIANQFKNESKRLRDWLEYYRDRGVTEFVLFDDHSTDGSREVIESVDGIHAVVMNSPFDALSFHNGKDTEAYKGDVSLALAISSNFRIIHNFVKKNYGPNTLLGFFDVDEYIVGYDKDLGKIIRSVASDWLMTSLCSFEIDSDYIDLNSDVPMIKQTTRTTSTINRTRCTRSTTVKSFINLGREDSNLAFSAPIDAVGESIHCCGIPSWHLYFNEKNQSVRGHYKNQPQTDDEGYSVDGRLLLAPPNVLKFLHYRKPAYDLETNKPLFDIDCFVP